MGITNSNKELSATRVDCGGLFNVRLSLTAEPDIIRNPTDIVLILDRSTSMAGSPLANLKNGAKRFIDIIDEATDSKHDGQLGGGSRMAVVSFATSATQDTGLTTDVSELKQAVDQLSASGYTNHADAFSKAMQLLAAPSANAKVMVMFTDGDTTAGTDPAPIAEAAKEQGITIYAIGLSGRGGLDEKALIAWASAPPSSYVAITPDDAELEKLFEDLAKNISKPGATNIVVRDRISDCFRILSVAAPGKGTAMMLDNNNIEWRINELGVIQSEGATLEFTVQHTGICSGPVEVNESIFYSDDEQNEVTFPSPEIFVDCGTDVLPESCPQPVDLTVGGCSDTVEFDAGELIMESLGCIVQVNVTIRNVCPFRRVAVAAILTETDEHGVEYQRGMKILTVPAHTADRCRDITLRCIRFVLPESLNVSGNPDAPCGERNLKVRFISNYIDSGFNCCQINS